MSDRFVAGEIVEIAPDVRRLLAPNPGVMTGPGTNTYILGRRELGIIDPGPEIESHIEKLASLGNIAWIAVTHTHRDHSPAAQGLARRTGAIRVGAAVPNEGPQDRGFDPDTVLAHGESLTVDGTQVTAVATPGHASNHLCYWIEQRGWLFTGDHIMGGSTVVIAPPDGDMSAYLVSLTALRALGLKRLLPGHGAPIDDPLAAIDGLIQHRLRREAKVIAALSSDEPRPLTTLLPRVYDDVPKTMHGPAALSLRAHVEKLVRDGIVEQQENTFRLLRPCLP